ncbi:hypothetical protein SH1V18_32380 [Vallitalea longa]|uniref:TIR domain-containing protein n=1 Tax=Vallitalea longa TaxID=2936439 RepID=A0A9W5YEA9_9FIRM|nr:toll/interleukin-1 receptor domain-containing protein [Vallitalea longa]GKX30758.1 hypothetical protein SH1V18_32380 [Vallitalea longa]
MKVFVSHSTNDKDKIEGLILALERLKCDVFYSSKSYTNSIAFGDNFYETIKKGIKESDYILAIVSESFYNSIPCQIEMGIAYAYNKKITPIRVENEDYSKLLKGLFTSNNRLASIYSEDDMIEILSLFSNNTSKIISCARSIVNRFNKKETTNLNINNNGQKKDEVFNKSNNHVRDIIHSTNNEPIKVKENNYDQKSFGYVLPNNLRGRSIHEHIIPTVCNLEIMLNKLNDYHGDFSKLKQWEKRSYKAYKIEDIKSQIIYSHSSEWVQIIRNHILNGNPIEFGASCIDIYLVAYVSQMHGKGKDKFFEYVKINNISTKYNSAQAIWQVGKGDGVYLKILNKNGTIKDWDFIEKWSQI